MGFQNLTVQRDSEIPPPNRSTPDTSCHVLRALSELLAVVLSCLEYKRD